MRLGQRPLASPMLVSDRGGAQSQSRVLAALGTAEQKAMAALLGSEREWSPPKNVPSLTYGAAEAAAYFAWLAEHLSTVSADYGARPTFALDALAFPSLMITLKRTEKEYSSLVHTAEGKLADARATLVGLASAFSAPPPDRTTDDALETLWKKALSSDAKSLIDTDSTAPRLEFDQLVRIVVDHCQRSYATDIDEARWATAPAHTNQFTRRALGAWRDALEAHQVRLARGAASSVNVYPYVALEPLPRNPNQLVLLAVTPFDPWFVDDRVPEDRRMPEILLAVYETPGELRLSAKDLRELETTLAAHLGRFTYRLMSSRRGDALANSAGEGAEIARHWFGQGVSRFLRETDGGGLEFEDVVQFWRRFVEELLCAKIDGVHQTETFPFDRAYIIRGTPAVALSEASSTITVIETAVQSRQADTNFRSLTSSERDHLGVELEDLNLTEKVIKYTREIDLVRADETDCIFVRARSGDSSDDDERANEEYRIDVAKLFDDSVGAEDTPSQRVLASLLAQLAAKSGSETVANQQLADLRRRVRSCFNQGGLLYDFHAGVAMQGDQPEAPLLFEIDSAYRSLFTDELVKGAGARKKKKAASGGDAKFVLFSFEPILALNNQKTTTGKEQAGQYFLGPEHAITVILVADVDVEKGIQEITAEKGDLQVLIEMILQQRIRDRRRESSTIDSRVSLIEGVLGSFVHKFGNLINTGDRDTDNRRRKELNKLRDGLLRIIKFNQESLVPVETEHDAAAIAKLIWQTTAHIDDGGAEDFEQSLRSFVNDVVAKEAAARGEAIPEPELDIAFGSAPTLRARLPLEAIKECVEVMLSNAVQAAVSARAPKPARLRIAAQVLVSPNSNDWVWDFTIENTTAPIPADVWISLTKDEPEAQASANDQKSRSTGIGVYMARQLLRSAFGRRADIRYFLLQENYLRASLQVPVQAIAPVAPVASTASSPAAPVSASAQILYIEDNAIHAERTKDWLKTQLPSIGLAHAANVVEAQGHAKQIGPFRLVISDLTIPDGPGGQAKKNRGPQALAAVLKRGTTAPIWILTGDSWESAQKTLILYLKPDEFGYAIAPIEDQLSRLDEQKLITILPAVKSLEGGANSAPVEHALAALFHNAHHDDKAMPREPSMPNDSLSIATVSMKDGDEQNWQSAALATSGGIVVVDADDIPLVDALQAWITHEGFPELGRHHSSDPSPYPLWDSTVHRWIAMRTPSAKALSAPARYWCLRHNIIPTDLSAKECAPHWAALISEASGPLGLVRHEIANMRGAALSESALFQVVRQRVSALEDVMCFASTDEAQLDSALSSGAVARLAERLSELEARKTGDPAHLFELLEQALIDLLRRAEEVSPGEAEALRRLQHSVRAMDRLLSISGQAAS